VFAARPKGKAPSVYKLDPEAWMVISDQTRKAGRVTRTNHKRHGVVSLVTTQRCGHPGQQHGLRMPPLSLSMPTSMRRFLVSSLLADVTQQIHSFRAGGVISVQRLFAAALDSMAFRKSAGSLCTVPPAIF